MTLFFTGVIILLFFMAGGMKFNRQTRIYPRYLFSLVEIVTRLTWGEKFILTFFHTDEKSHRPVADILLRIPTSPHKEECK